MNQDQAFKAAQLAFDLMDDGYKEGDEPETPEARFYVVAQGDDYLEGPLPKAAAEEVLARCIAGWPEEGPYEVREDEERALKDLALAAQHERDFPARTCGRGLLEYEKELQQAKVEAQLLWQAATAAAGDLTGTARARIQLGTAVPENILIELAVLAKTSVCRALHIGAGVPTVFTRFEALRDGVHIEAQTDRPATPGDSDLQAFNAAEGFRPATRAEVDAALTSPPPSTTTNQAPAMLAAA